jgi:predicted nuclease of predicted toxin-antitoxin system
MKLLVDANLSPRVAARLREDGHDATHVADHDLLLASDEAILRRAAEIGCSIISSDSAARSSPQTATSPPCSH